MAQRREQSANDQPAQFLVNGPQMVACDGERLSGLCSLSHMSRVSGRVQLAKPRVMDVRDGQHRTYGILQPKRCLSVVQPPVRRSRDRNPPGRISGSSDARREAILTGRMTFSVL